MQAWKTLRRTTILNHSRFLTVENHAVELPDGRVIPDWPWIITPDFVNVVAVTDDGSFLCFRQTKYALDSVSLAPVGGYVELGEDPLAAAQRELLEETGYESSKWTSLGQFAVDANRGAGQAHLFLAENARRLQAPRNDDLEEQVLLLLSRGDVEAALSSGEFKVLPWAVAFALALRHLEVSSGKV